LIVDGNVSVIREYLVWCSTVMFLIGFYWVLLGSRGQRHGQRQNE
jgi:hypothetical protein